MLKKLLKSITAGGIGGAVAVYVLQHINLTALGAVGALLAPVVAAAVAALTHEAQGK